MRFLICSLLVVVCLGGCRTAVPKQVIPLRSTPKGAAVFVDGRAAGETNTKLRLAQNEPVDVVLRLEGYPDLELFIEPRRKTGEFVFDLLRGLILPIPILSALDVLRNSEDPEYFELYPRAVDHDFGSGATDFGRSPLLEQAADRAINALDGMTGPAAE